uniref:Ovule protein n=1 Tax=Steinernema glaseri TaxID=37863 RepID=A0A1I7Z2Y9_9BILA
MWSQVHDKSTLYPYLRLWHVKVKIQSCSGVLQPCLEAIFIHKEVDGVSSDSNYDNYEFCGTTIALCFFEEGDVYCKVTGCPVFLQLITS